MRTQYRPFAAGLREVFLMDGNIGMLKLFTRSILWLLIVALAPLTCAYAETSAETKRPFPEVQAEAARLAAQGYSVIGPAMVRSYDSKTLVLDPERMGTSYALSGKTLVVKDQNLKQTGSYAIAKGSMVFVCTKSKEIIVFVVKDDGTTRGDNADAGKGAN
ncbi:MAG: hypothetical protein AB1646_12835 [Thermodesulfobacteriota bacterium]